MPGSHILNLAWADVQRELRAADNKSPVPFVCESSLRHSRNWFCAFGGLPENRIQLLCIDRIGARKVHLGRLARAPSILVIHFVEKPAAQVFVISLKGRLRSWPQ